MRLIARQSDKSRSVSLSISLALPMAWAFTVLLVGRTTPWQANRSWLLVFTTFLVLSGIWWNRFFNDVSKNHLKAKERILAMAGGAAPSLAMAFGTLGLVYFSDHVNAMLEWPHWRMQIVSGTAIIAVVLETAQVGALVWARDPGVGIRGAVLNALSKRANVIILGCLAVVGVLQATAMVTPVGDDIFRYTDKADTLLRGQLWFQPNFTQVVGDVAFTDLPLFPVLLTLSFALLGRNAVGISSPGVVATALFPLALYAAVKSITGSRPVACATALLTFLFPLLQIHAIGTPHPDTVFMDLLLAGTALSGKAISSSKNRYWVGMGAVMALASLTRQEGAYYSALLFITFFIVYRSRRSYWLALGAYICVLAPFVVLYYSATGSLWPARIGSNALSWNNLQANLNQLSWASLPWYSQAIGLEKDMLVDAVLVLMAGVVLGIIVLLWRHPALAGIPLAAVGNVAMLLSVPPDLTYSLFPPDVLRHASYGIVCAVPALAYAVHTGLQFAVHLPKESKPLLLAAALLLSSVGIYYEAEHLARPEWWAGGRWRLLWTGSSYLLTDVLDHPTPLWGIDEPKTFDNTYGKIYGPLEGLNLNRVNRSEPYHWTSLLISLLALTYSVLSVDRSAGARGYFKSRQGLQSEYKS